MICTNSDNICRKCSESCETCSGPANNECLSCKAQAQLQENKCQSGNQLVLTFKLLNF